MRKPGTQRDEHVGVAGARCWVFRRQASMFDVGSNTAKGQSRFRW